ncbi:MAG: nitroreductase family protein [Ignavibacteriales bacterium]
MELGDLARATLQLIKDRRSIRQFKPDAVPDEALEIILESGRQAPSGEDAQPWRFVVVKNRVVIQKLGEISGRGSGRRFTGEFLTKKLQERFKGLEDPVKREAVFKKLTSGQVSSFVGTAPVVLAVCGKKGVWDLPYDCSAAIENILLMVTALGLGACWVIAPCIDVRDELDIKALLNVPEDVKVISLIPIGWPARNPGPRPRLPLDEISFLDSYGVPLFRGGEADA